MTNEEADRLTLSHLYLTPRVHYPFFREVMAMSPERRAKVAEMADFYRNVRPDYATGKG